MIYNKYRSKSSQCDLDANMELIDLLLEFIRRINVCVCALWLKFECFPMSCQFGINFVKEILVV